MSSSPMHRCFLTRGILLAFVAFGLGGCGYSNKTLFPEQYQTVSAPIFENRTFERGVEVDLAEALTKQIESQTPYKVVSPAGARTLIQGTILGVQRNTINRHRPGAVPEQVEVTITIDFEWKDLKTGKTIVDRRNFPGIGLFVPTRPVSEPFEKAQHQAVQRLAADLVAAMRSDW